MQSYSYAVYVDMLQKLLDADISFAELRGKAINFRALQAVEGAFVRTTNSSSCNAAVQQFPHHGTEERLSLFTNLSFKGELPYSFKDYYCRVMLCTDSKFTFTTSPLQVAFPRC